MLAIGLCFLLVGVALTIHSTVPEQEKNTTWELMKSEPSTLEISANFTAGDIVKLEIAPSHEWMQEPEVDDVPYPHIFVYVNVTSPKGDQSYYEITYVNYFFYRAILKAPGGFSGEYGNETLNAERAVVGKVMYDGQYLARIIGVILPGGPPRAEALTLYKGIENIKTTYPYKAEFNVALVTLLIGGGISIWSIRLRKRPIKSKRRTRSSNLHKIIKLNPPDVTKS